MKTYILTEDQFNRIELNDKRNGIKKGIALKVTPTRNSEPYYESEIKSFGDEQEFNEYKNNLGDKKEIIGVIDIKDETNG
jgi:hypothetical protein